MRNDYCERLETLRVPHVEEFVGKRVLLGRATLFDLMIVALLENGGPMALESIAARLSQAGAESKIGDMLLSLKKSWRRREPLYEDELGRVALNVTHRELGLKLFTLGLRPPHVEPLPELQPAEPPGGNVPLSLEEVDAAFRGRRLISVSTTRIAAAVLDAHGKAMSAAEVDEYLESIDVSFLSARTNRWDKASGVVELSGPHLILRQDAKQLAAMRKHVRSQAKPELRRRARKERFRIQHARADALLAERDRKEREEAASLRRVVLRLVPEAGEIAGVAMLDLGTMNVRSFGDDEVDGARDWLQSFDVAIGLEIRESLKRLGVRLAGFRTLELGPPRKTQKLNERGDRLRLTPELVISSSTGIRRPLADAAKISNDIATGRVEQVRKALERDVSSLHALYEYARLHGYVRVRSGFLDERIAFDWPLPRDGDLLSIALRKAEREGRPVELVLGTAPDWRDPWRTARRGFVSVLHWDSFRFQEESRVLLCDGADVQALRGADSPSPEG